MSIQVQQLCKQYGSQLAVNNISFEARPGQITGFLGPNGAGKSTTMKMLTGYLQPDSGTALVSDLNVVTAPEKVKQQIGYLPESNALYYDLYIREYLAFTGALYKVPNLKQRVEDVITQVGLTIEANKKIGQLSKGYKQRVGLAAAIIHNPAVLILDEPTTGLDPNQIVEIRQVIKTLSEDKTVLLSTHIMQEVEAICEQVIIINKGSIVANAPLQQLRSKSDGQQLRVSFTETIEAEWLLRLPGILAAEKTDSQSWTLQTNNAQDTRKALMQLALNENLNIRSMQEGGSLESIFRELTTNTVAEK